MHASPFPPWSFPLSLSMALFHIPNSLPCLPYQAPVHQYEVICFFFFFSDQYYSSPSSVSTLTISDPKDNLRTLLRSGNPDFEVKESVLSRIVTSPYLCIQAISVTLPEEAYTLYANAENSPQSTTRAFAMEYGVMIDGQLLFPGRQRALFVRAFENGNVAMVLKIPHEASHVPKECLLYEHVGEDAKRHDIALVPVRNLPLQERSSHCPGTSSPERSLRAGILMPNYSYTLHDIPKPISILIATELFNRLSRAIDFLHDRKWLHGDVKSANIFCKDDGHAYLGDYGSSVRYDDLRHFTGGTPRYQCADVNFIEDPRRFDRMGLLLSLLEKLGKIELTDQIPVTSEKLEVALQGMASDVASDLHDAMMAWINK